jgi:hypothetical protein
MLTTVEKAIYCTAEHYLPRTAEEIKTNKLPYWDDIRKMPLPKTNGLMDLINKNKETMAAVSSSTLLELSQDSRLATVPDTMVINEGWIADLKKTSFNHFTQDLVNAAANPTAMQRMDQSLEKMAGWLVGKLTGAVQPPSAADLLDSLERVFLHEVKLTACTNILDCDF